MVINTAPKYPSVFNHGRITATIYDGTQTTVVELYHGTFISWYHGITTEIFRLLYYYSTIKELKGLAIPYFNSYFNFRRSLRCIGCGLMNASTSRRQSLHFRLMNGLPPVYLCLLIYIPRWTSWFVFGVVGPRHGPENSFFDRQSGISGLRRGSLEQSAATCHFRPQPQHFPYPPQDIFVFSRTTLV
jgi:hypothetical protein